MILLWKLHNAVSSSVDGSKDCKSEELFDNDQGGLFKCISKTDDELFSGSGPRMGRQWPFAKRFEFSMLQPGAWQRLRQDPEVLRALRLLKELDNEHDLRSGYWTEGAQKNLTAGALVVAAVTQLDQAMLKTDILRSEFPVNADLDCGSLDAVLQQWATLGKPEIDSPVLADGQFSFLPEGCRATNQSDAKDQAELISELSADLQKALANGLRLTQTCRNSD